MKKIILASIASLSIAALTFSAALISGCASTPAGSNVATLPPISPKIIGDVTETATVGIVTAKPQYRPLFVEATNVLGSAIAGGTISPTNIVSTVQGFGFIPANFVTQPELQLVVQDLNDLTSQLATQSSGNSVLDNSNFVATATAINGGIIKGLNLVP